MAADLLSVADIVAATGLSDATIRREIRDGRLKAQKKRGRLVILRREYEQWLERDDATKPAAVPTAPAVLPRPAAASGIVYPWEKTAPGAR